jgi:hypothetical protein
MRRLNNFLLAACLPALLAAPALAVFEDVPAGARQAGLGGQSAALEDPLAVFANPALPGASRKFETGAWFMTSERTTQGPADYNLYGAWASVPRMAGGKMGTLTLAGSYRDDGGLATEKTIAFGWGTWNLARLEAGVLDFGANFKIMSAAVTGGESASGFGVDFGAAFRPDDSHVLGFSVLNLNNPSYSIGTLEDKAPTVLRLAATERRQDYTLSLDLAKRTASGGGNGNFSVTPGVEHIWRTERYGTLFSRSGLFLAERATALSAGFGWRRLASDLAYSLSVPLTGAVVPAHSVTFTLRFGERDLDSEYERLIKQEIKYRKDLVEALDESARRENLLKEELASMKAEIDSLTSQLKDTQEKKADVAAEKERLAAVVRRQQAAEAEMKALAVKRAADRLNQIKYNFSVDWQGYLKLKGGGAPPDVLKNSLQRIVSQYQDSGVDISQATLELQALVK